MNIFKDKKICLILTCDRPHYLERIKRMKQDISFLIEQGFLIVYLYGNSPSWKTELQPINDHEYKLYVPVMDCYELLSYKMEAAYTYFNNTGCQGILKIDDDIKILDKEKFSNTIIPLVNVFDYMGVYEIIHPGGILCPEIHKYTLNLFKTLHVCIPSGLRYFPGGFYWISNNSINTITSISLNFFAEDMSVGYAVSQNTNLSTYVNNDFFNTIITWDNKTET